MSACKKKDIGVVMGKRLEVIDVNRRTKSEQDELSIEEKRRNRQRIRARRQQIKRRRRRRLMRLMTAGVLVVILGVIIKLPDLKKETMGDTVGSTDTLSTDAWYSTSGRIEQLLYEVKYEDFFKDNKLIL